MSITLINLPQPTVLFNILSMCDLKDLYNLRCLSTDYMFLVDFYLSKCKKIRLSSCLVKNKDAFNILTANCYFVKYLSISGCSYLDKQETLFMLFLKNNHKHLTEINLSYCNSITSKSMQDIIVNCKELNTLILAGCSWFTTGTLDSLTFHQNKLHTADFTRCVNLSEKSILKFIVKFCDLKYLSIAYIHSVTEQVLVTIMNHCPKLEHFIISATQFSLNGFRFPEMRPKIMVML